MLVQPRRRAAAANPGFGVIRSDAMTGCPPGAAKRKGKCMKKLVSATVSAALCMLSVTPAFAQDTRFTGFDAPRGATVSANLRIPLGREAKRRPSYGLTLGYGQETGAGLDGRTVTRAFRLADLR